MMVHIYKYTYIKHIHYIFMNALHCIQAQIFTIYINHIHLPLPHFSFIIFHYYQLRLLHHHFVLVFSVQFVRSIYLRLVMEDVLEVMRPQPQLMPKTNISASHARILLNLLYYAMYLYLVWMLLYAQPSRNEF